MLKDNDARATPALDRALLVVARNPEMPDRALAIASRTSFATVARARSWLGFAPSRATGRRTKRELPIDADAAEYWSRDQLMRMHAAFAAAMEKAIKRGLERAPQRDASERAA